MIGSIELALSNVSARKAKTQPIDGNPWWIRVTLLLILLLLYLNFKRITETLIVMLSVPFALVGGVWLMWALDYNMSVAVAIGFIALVGVAAKTGDLHAAIMACCPSCG